MTSRPPELTELIGELDTPPDLAIDETRVLRAGRGALRRRRAAQGFGAVTAVAVLAAVVYPVVQGARNATVPAGPSIVSGTAAPTPDADGTSVQVGEPPIRLDIHWQGDLATGAGTVAVERVDGATAQPVWSVDLDDVVDSLGAGSVTTLPDEPRVRIGVFRAPTALHDDPSMRTTVTELPGGWSFLAQQSPGATVGDDLTWLSEQTAYGLHGPLRQARFGTAARWATIYEQPSALWRVQASGGACTPDAPPPSACRWRDTPAATPEQQPTLDLAAGVLPSGSTEVRLTTAGGPWSVQTQIVENDDEARLAVFASASPAGSGATTGPATLSWRDDAGRPHSLTLTASR